MNCQIAAVQQRGNLAAWRNAFGSLLNGDEEIMKYVRARHRNAGKERACWPESMIAVLVP